MKRTEMKIGIAGPVQIMRFKDFLYAGQDSYYEAGMGGQAVTAIALGLLNKGYRVAVYTLSPDITEPVILKGSRLNIYIGKYRVCRRFNIRYFFDFKRKESKQIEAFIINDKPDIVNAHWSYEYAIGAVKSKYPHVICFRDNAAKIFQLSKHPAFFLRGLMDKWVKKNGINFMANSEYLRSSLNLNIPAVPNPYSGTYGESKILPDNNTIKIVSAMNGFSGWKNAKKGIMGFNKLIANHHINAEYSIFGTDYEAGGIAEKWTVKNKLGKNIRCGGYVSHSELLDKLSEYHILLHPSLEESFGNVLIEAMAKGLVVVGGKNSGAVPHVLQNGEIGILTDVSSPDDIANSLYSLCCNPSLYSDMSKKALDVVSSEYEINRIVEQYLDIYEQVLNTCRYRI